MEIHRDNVIAASNDEHVRDELGCDGRSRLVFLVYARVGEAGHDGGDAARGGGLARGDEDEELHEVVVDVAASGLEDEDVLLAHGLADLHARLAIGELLDDAGRELDVQSTNALVNVSQLARVEFQVRSSPLGHSLGELGMAIA